MFLFVVEDTNAPDTLTKEQFDVTLAAAKGDDKTKNYGNNFNDYFFESFYPYNQDPYGSWPSSPYHSPAGPTGLPGSGGFQSTTPYINIWNQGSSSDTGSNYGSGSGGRGGGSGEEETTGISGDEGTEVGPEFISVPTTLGPSSATTTTAATTTIDLGLTTTTDSETTTTDLLLGSGSGQTTTTTTDSATTTIDPDQTTTTGSTTSTTGQTRTTATDDMASTTTEGNTTSTDPLIRRKRAAENYTVTTTQTPPASTLPPYDGKIMFFNDANINIFLVRLTNTYLTLSFCLYFFRHHRSGIFLQRNGAPA